MSLEEYKKEVEYFYKKEHPQRTKEEIESQMQAPEELWRWRLENFSSEVMAQCLDSGLV